MKAVEAALDDVVHSSSQPALGAIRLAWWREALQRLDHYPAPAEPRLQAVATHLLPLGIAGSDLANLEDSRAALLDEVVDPLRVVMGGERSFAICAKILDADDERLAVAGRMTSLAAIARKGELMFPPTEYLRGLERHRFARRLRPLTALARLAARDLKQFPRIEPEATPGRAAALLSHRLFGTVA